MTSLSQLLGPSASCPPSPAAAAAIRKVVLGPRTNYPKTGEQSAPRQQDGADVYAYAVQHGIATVDEIRPALTRWRDEEMLNRGLGSVDGPSASAVWTDPYTQLVWLNKNGAPIQVTVQDCQHATMSQYVVNRLLLTNDMTAKKAASDLVDAILKDSTLDPASKVVNSRQLGRPLIALMQEGSDKAKVGAGVLVGKVLAQMGSKNGLHFYTLNTNAGADHAELPISPQQESTILKGLALTYREWPTAAIRDAIFLGLAGAADAQMPDGSFANDMGWDMDGTVLKNNPGKVMDLWIVPAIIEAKAALGSLWPGKAQAMLDRAKALWLATDYTKPSDVNFKFQNTLSVTIGCAPEWGWRS